MRIALLGPSHGNDYGAGFFCGDQEIGYRGAPFVSVLATALAHLGHEVLVVTLDKSGIQKKVTSLEGVVTLSVVPSRPSALKPSRGGLGMLFDSYKAERANMAECVIRWKPDVVHAHWAYEFALAAIDSQLPSVVSVHDSPVDVLNAHFSLRNFLRLRVARKVVATGIPLLSVSPYISESIARLPGVNLIGSLPNPLSNDLFKVGVDLSKPRPRDFLYVSNYWTPLKNPKIALQAFAMLRQEFPDAILHCIGSDFAANGLAYKWASKKGVTSGVVFHGPKVHSEVLSIARECLGLLHPSRTESFGMAVVEAMALGAVPIVYSNAGALPWIVGSAGCVTQDFKSESFAAQMKSLILDSEKTGELARRAVGRSYGLCNSAEVARRAVNFYNQVLSVK